jgi:hypothetical protein
LDPAILLEQLESRRLLKSHLSLLEKQEGGK